MEIFHLLYISFDHSVMPRCNHGLNFPYQKIFPYVFASDVRAKDEKDVFRAVWNLNLLSRDSWSLVNTQ